MAQQVHLDSSARAEMPDAAETRVAGLHVLSNDIAYRRLLMVNVIFIGEAGSRNWVLVDCGLPGTAGLITEAAEQRYGRNTPPAAIILTHGHFDHVGGLNSLLNTWNVPVYAHSLEFPYLTGSAAYPPPDPKVGGGLMSVLSRLYPNEPIQVGPSLRELPEDGTIPPLPQWRWVHVPGHTPGQVALWRESDRFLIAADAFITTAQESAYSVAFQTLEMHGPPKYYTQDWDASKTSLRRLAALEPEFAITGHGRAVQGPQLRDALAQLAQSFDTVARPEQGKYVHAPARVEDGSAYRPVQH